MRAVFAKPLRMALTALCAAAGAMLTAGCAPTATPALQQAEAAEPVAVAPVALQVAPGVYMLRGASGEVDSANLGRIGNAGFIVGPNGVLAIDTGTSYRHGQALISAIRQITDRPIRLVLVRAAGVGCVRGFAGPTEAAWRRGITRKLPPRHTILGSAINAQPFSAPFEDRLTRGGCRVRGAMGKEKGRLKALSSGKTAFESTILDRRAPHHQARHG